MIYKTIHITSTTSIGFCEKLAKAVEMLHQECLLDIEIQYKPIARSNNIVYTALLIGRKRR